MLPSVVKEVQLFIHFYCIPIRLAGVTAHFIPQWIFYSFLIFSFCQIPNIGSESFGKTSIAFAWAKKNLMTFRASEKRPNCRFRLRGSKCFSK